MTVIHPAGPYLIYAADLSFKKGMSIEEMHSYADRTLDEACKAADGLGITIKGNTLFRHLGVKVFLRLKQAGCGVFADYKLFDVRGTCMNDASWLQNIQDLRILTVHANVHTDVFQNLATMLPNTLVCPVDPLTDLNDENFKFQGRSSRAAATAQFFNRVRNVKAGGLICAAPDIAGMPEDVRTTHKSVSPGSRPDWYEDPKDTNTDNAMTPTEAIEAGADQIVIGGPAREGGEVSRRALNRILDEIAAAKGL